MLGMESLLVITQLAATYCQGIMPWTRIMKIITIGVAATEKITVAIRTTPISKRFLHTNNLLL